ncbi:MAG: hypothetical protein KDD29_01660 [Flavobacteriales bacterium]|nr:hypothetical protein [Flavobacteriales bacterium]MCB9335312.1 hypothetical protein [Flavobacteriales bacterium]
MEEYLQKVTKNIEFYEQACGLKDRRKVLKKIKEVSKIKNDIPVFLFGIMNCLCSDNPEYYWKRDVANEIENIIEPIVKQNITKFNNSIISSSIEFFESIRAFENITNIIVELRDVSFEEGYKTKLIRNPLLNQIYEDFLMNLYRLIKNIIDAFSDKDYSNLNTLGKIIPCLKKHGFNKSTEINIDIRNAINHGNLFVKGNKIEYRFGKTPQSYEYKTINIWEYDSIINEAYDIGCGILVGFFKILSKYPEIIINHYDSSEENAKEWYRLIYKNSKIRVLYLNSVKTNNINQFNVHIETNIENKNNLIFALIELARGAFFRFPKYNSYFIGYEHNRSSSGFIRLTNEQLSSTNNISELYKMILENKDILMMPILSSEININAFKFQVFPKIKSEYYEIQNIKDCSIENFKRISATVILTKKYSKKNTRIIIDKIISELKPLKTSQNPYIETKYGEEDCDIIFINIFTHTYNRKMFNLFPSNNSFVCTAHYYKNHSCPKLTHGGVMKSLWDSYKKEKHKNIVIAWNPKF